MTAVPQPASSPEAPAPSSVDLARGRLMQAALKALLNRVRGSREVLPHLAALESALGRKGVDAVKQISPTWLPRIYSQLSSLPIAASEPLLLDLQQRLFEQLQPKTRMAAAAPAASPRGPAESSRSAPPREFLSTFDSDSRLMVGEVSHTDFMREIDAAKSGSN